MPELLDVRLEAPETHLSELSFAGTSTSAINQWAASLPIVNIAETATALKLATAELALLNTNPREKFEFLETIRPLLHYICTRLDRASLSANKNAKELPSQRLLLNLCNGYKDVVLRCIEDLKNDKAANKELLPSALHRLISDLTRILLRSLQFYVKPPANFWWEINELFRISHALGIQDFTLADEENHQAAELTLEQAYMRALLLASCKPNQLQHAQLGQVFNALESWVHFVNLAPGPSDALLMVDLLANSGPSYNKLHANPGEPRGFHTELLTYELEAYLNEVDGQIDVPKSLREGVVRQLVDAWSVMQERNFSRLRTNVPVRVAVGLRATHYFLSGGCQFNDQLSNTDALLRREINPFLDVDYEPTQVEDTDPWSQAHDLKVRIPENPNITAPERILWRAQNNHDHHAEQQSQRVFEHYETIAVDTSPGGYRMEWQDSVPSNAAVGELLAVREEKAARWCVAVIRWLRQEGKRISMGVELLSPRAIPVAVRGIQKRGGPTDYARGLLLPRIEALHQQATLITPSVPFAEKQKIHIQRQGIQTTGQLLETQLKTESFNQFTFRMLDGYLENTRSEPNIDSLSAMTREDTNQGP
jgi:cyclic-di-GMP-binding protein